MKLQLGLNQKLSQQLKLAPQIIQSIEILQLPAMDLKELIENELQENEALEVVEAAPDEFADRAYEEREARHKADEDQSSDFEVRAFSEGSSVSNSESAAVAERDGATGEGAASEGAANATTDGAESGEAASDELNSPETASLLERIDGLRANERGPDGDRSRSAAQEASDRKLEAMQNAPAHGPSLADHLLLQLDEVEFADTELPASSPRGALSEEVQPANVSSDGVNSEGVNSEDVNSIREEAGDSGGVESTRSGPEVGASVRRAAEAVIYNLNDRGLLDCSDEEILGGMDSPVSMEILHEAILAVQRLEPRGVGARTVAECILLQISNSDPDAPMLRLLIREHFDDLLRNKRPKIAKSMGLEIAELNQLTERLRDFDFRPGAAFSSGTPRYIRPDVIIEMLTDADLEAIRSGDVRDTNAERSSNRFSTYSNTGEGASSSSTDSSVDSEGQPDRSASYSNRDGSSYSPGQSAHLTNGRSFDDPYNLENRNSSRLESGQVESGGRSTKDSDPSHRTSSEPSSSTGNASSPRSSSGGPDLGRYTVRLVNDHLPRVGLSPAVRKLIADQNHDASVRDYLKRKLEAARWLIDAIAQRQSTLERVAREIVARQRDFLDFGVSHLRPLKMQEVADELGIHVSTVSRAISDKYAQTPRGIVPLKFFFTGGTENEDGGIESRNSVKERVREIIDNEDKQKPLSDDDVAEQLKQNFGLEIARRTVTKYRKALDIPSSRQRRIWK